jgi:hypothetical protein
MFTHTGWLWCYTCLGHPPGVAQSPLPWAPAQPWSWGQGCVEMVLAPLLKMRVYFWTLFYPICVVVCLYDSTTLSWLLKLSHNMVWNQEELNPPTKFFFKTDLTIGVLWESIWILGWFLLFLQNKYHWDVDRGCIHPIGHLGQCGHLRVLDLPTYERGMSLNSLCLIS